jgi:18S rRNA (adenine1779-N6/adenine1780-N6)-dimethyltransferase
VRLAFQRKNKTLRAIIMNKHVLGIIEKNYRTYCSLHNKTPVEAPIKEVIGKILDAGEFGDKRASKMDQDDFLR